MGQKRRRGEWRRVTARNIFLPRFFEYSVPPTIPYINEIFKNKKKDKKKKNDRVPERHYRFAAFS